MATNIRKVSLLDLVGDSHLRNSVSDKVLTRALDSKAVKEVTSKEVKEVRTLLAEVTDVDGLATVAQAVRAKYGDQTSITREAQVLAQAVKVMQAVRKAVILDAKNKGLLGRKAGQITGVALAEALGCSPQYVTNVANGHTTPRVSDKADDKADDDTSDAPGTSDEAPAESTSTDPVTALAQAVTRVENASKAIVGTRENAEEIRRLSNALALASRHLSSVADTFAQAV
jgi:hypothetical protein